MKQIGGGHPILSWCPFTIFDIAHATGQIRHPNVDIQNLLEKLVLMQVETSQLKEVKFPTNKPNILPFIAALGKVPTWDHQIWNLLNVSMLLIFFSLFWAKSYM